MLEAWKDVLKERVRQVKEESWSLDHDDSHTHCDLSTAAACYALDDGANEVPELWPWTSESWKPKTYRENLVRAAALLIAEIERVDRRDG